MNRLVELCKHNECTGCMACVGSCRNKAISIEIDNEGFSHPKIDHEKCVGCKLCQNICPVLNPISHYKSGKVYAAWSKRDDIRLNSSSGGVFSELAIAILKSGGVVVGAYMDSNGYVFHKMIETEYELNDLRGSKYVQSNVLPSLLTEIRETLKKNRKVLFTGTPCQIAGIRKLYHDNDNLYTMDLVCHGVPSPEFFAKIYADIKKDYPNIVSYNFRKLDSWAVCGSVNINININNTIINQPLYGKYTLYQDAFLKGFLHRQNCYNCQYACIDRVGDITVADFWGIGIYKPIIEEHRKGCSMISINSNKGFLLFEQIKENIYFEERDIQETIDGGNEQLIKCSTKPFGRDSFYRDSKVLSLQKLIKKYNLKTRNNPSVLNRLAYKIKKFIIK